MLKVQEIREIIKLIDQSSIDEFSFESNGTKVKLKKNNGSHPVEYGTQSSTFFSEPLNGQPVTTQEIAAHPVAQEVTSVEEKPSAVNDTTLHQITSPMVGTFYQSPSPDAGAFVSIGDKVSNSSIVCIVEAMKLFNEIEAEVSGEIVEILVKDGQLVEYGQPLFLVRPN